MNKKYLVKVIYKYSDTVNVIADSEEDAIEKASYMGNESYESFYDAEILETSDAE